MEKMPFTLRVTLGAIEFEEISAEEVNLQGQPLPQLFQPLGCYTTFLCFPAKNEMSGVGTESDSKSDSESGPIRELKVLIMNLWTITIKASLTPPGMSSAIE